MNCYPFDQLQKYVLDELSDHEKVDIEDHIYHCDDCLNQYMSILTVQENDMPVLPKSDTFTDGVMAQISHQSKGKRSNKKHNQLIHYALAAGFTIMLTATGFFDGLTSMISEDAMNPTKAGSFSDQVLHRTVEMMDFINKEEMRMNENGK